MSNERYTLRMIFEGPYGESHQMAIDVSPCVARKQMRLPPPSPIFDSFAITCEKIKERELRKEMFISEAKRLGQKLAENMEDKEGWHGVDRQERTSKGSDNA